MEAGKQNIFLQALRESQAQIYPTCISGEQV